MRRWDWETIALVLVVKLLLFTYAAQVIATQSDGPVHWLKTWKRWDATHYLAIAARGYSAEGPDRILLAFFPLYPWLVRAATTVTRDVLSAAFVVSGLASIAIGLLMKRLVRLDEPETIARRAVWFLFILPTSFFLHIPYSEALFLALVLGCFLAARRDHWALAGILGSSACLTRITGVMLGPALVVEAFLQFRAQRRFRWRWLWIGVVPLGFVGYLWLNYHVTGNFFAFSEIQQEHWYKQFTPPWVGINDVWLRALDENPIEGLHELVFIALSLLCTIWCWFALRPSYAAWMTCNWLLVNSTTFVLSVPRYTLALFPVFILAARASRGRPVVFAGLSICSLLFLALYAGRFVRGLWAF